jgi:hypothetical protein
MHDKVLNATLLNSSNFAETACSVYVEDIMTSLKGDNLIRGKMKLYIA